MKKSGNILYIAVIVLFICYLMYSSYEGFENAPPKQCGVGLPSCSGDRIRCINGYCRSDIAPKLPTYSDLPMMP
jgi:hypothetical protein